jgi:hypothetical protein
MFFNKKKAEQVVENAENKIIECNNINVDIVEKKETDTYIWVEGYKGTDKNMVCSGCSYNGYLHSYMTYSTQYELNTEVSLAENEEESICKNGFHFCLNLRDVFGFYPYDFSNRFFKVRAYVKEKDYNNAVENKHKKLVARKIVLYEEVLSEYEDIPDDYLTVYSKNNNYKISKEIFENIRDSRLSLLDWIKEYFNNNMIKLGYSQTFTIVLRDEAIKNANDNSAVLADLMSLYTKAKAFKEEGMSADMSVYLLLKYL